ncbi:hypothetical protein FHU33_2596 [Blastococcus colisei]|uniref:Tetratricopeptide repeat protein n=1 Tax=Blastococcus colisei TaxID=1564162 RepID=A0A543PGI5_9ACTN|nr:hypothetical protein [Blastococcus colisei]TQN43166.1 hypothetical protein FHU33_2596 [Blastococcus colisei]
MDVRDLDPAVRGALRGMDPRNVERVAAHLVAAGTLVEEDPAAALAHARAARDRASRVAAVREAVGVAAYHAEDYAEAARELRAYRRMSGDEGYRAVLADCERALGRPEVALRLVAEALADKPDADETVELRIVESGARLDLGEAAAARLVLEAALGSPLDPSSLHPGDHARLRLASAYAELLELQGQADRAMDWFVAIAGADPEDITGAVDRLGIEFTDLEDVVVDVDARETAQAFDDQAPYQPGRSEEPAPPEVVAPLPEDDHGLGRSFDEEVEAEVAELLGEVDPPSDAAEPGEGHTGTH